MTKLDQIIVLMCAMEHADRAGGYEPDTPENLAARAKLLQAAAVKAAV